MVVVCCLLAWGLVISCSWAFFRQLIMGWISVKQLHQIPCHNCQYFTGSWRLKCPVNPILACSLAAVGCRDYQAVADKSIIGS
jgi:hypothetical protein